MRSITLVLVLGLLGGCFHDARQRRYAKFGEGAAIAGGIVMLSFAGTGADCTAGPAGRDAYDDCRFRATVVGDVGLGLILAGLLGFMVTAATGPDEPPPPPRALASGRPPMSGQPAAVPTPALPKR
jgi:hypothetical protein